MHIAGSQYHDWEIILPEHQGKIDLIAWAPQVTAPMPLAAINDIFSQAITQEGYSPLLPSSDRGKASITYVTRSFLQTRPNGISHTAITDDALGFLSLVLSYAMKAAAPGSGVDEDISPKFLTPIMPRTDFTSMYKEVRSALSGSLYPLIKVLACYKNEGDSVR